MIADNGPRSSHTWSRVTRHAILFGVAVPDAHSQIVPSISIQFATSIHRHNRKLTSRILAHWNRNYDANVCKWFSGTQWEDVYQDHSVSANFELVPSSSFDFARCQVFWVMMSRLIIWKNGSPDISGLSAPPPFAKRQTGCKLRLHVKASKSSVATSRLMVNAGEFPI